MPKKIAIIISPNYKDYAEKYLADCVDSIRKQDYQGEIKVFITDNETSSESFNLLSRLAPEANLILNKTNDGFAKGNNDAMKFALAQGFDYIFLINMDAAIENNCASELVKCAEKDENIGSVQARLMLYHDKNKINSLGNSTHFLGFGYCLGYNDRISDIGYRISDIFYPSGAAVLFKSEVLKQVGLFDEEFWMYNEDQDLGWRIWLAGYKCVLANSAVAYHKYEFSKSIKQYYWMDRNRIIAIIKNYHILTLLLIFPAFIIMEIGLILFSLKTGWFKEKMRVWKYFLTPAKWIYLISARKKTQKLRRVKDKDIIKLITGKIWYQEIDDVKLRLINPVFNAYWSIVKKLIVW
ncbi:glycosyltransferase family 2 protein [Patescibacteria group bacterium]|nr:glycosyltransferase family 2 protein [Candidatus Falkowbacteria bacterium]MBU3905816.1 glycosyltransferase family 2 protein [Patescibacteria group bacterium]MBU4015389.1 glycosyltransferase family 2 protein [Patescibacteria group bacterium]MBU4026011.1 glycosyltransferase family 2 protein [Patescibacteria group bacterium]MBU4072913.1 glycosyltransferase family 2 protein [Patescibacteria group bacterium]